MMITVPVNKYYCHLHNHVLSYVISDLNLLWSDRSYTSLGQCVHTDFLDSAVYRVGRTGFLSFFHVIHNDEHSVLCSVNILYML